MNGEDGEAPGGLWGGPRQSRRRGPLLVALAIVASAAWLAIGLGGPRATLWFDDLAQAVAAALAAWCCAAAAMRLVARERTAWALVAAGCASWACGELVWCWFELARGATAPFPSLADAGFLGAVPLLAAGVLVVPRLFEGSAGRAHALIDGLGIGTALLVLSWITVLGPTFGAHHDSALEQALSLSYPGGDVVICAVALLAVTRAHSSGRLALLLLASGLVCNAVADSSFAWFSAVGTYGAGNAIDAGWIAGFLLIALAGRRAAPARRLVEAAPRLPSPVRLLLPYAPLVVAFAVAAVAHRPIARRDPVGVGVLALIVLVMARQLVALMENAGLLRSLGRDGLTGLFHRHLFRSRVEDVLADPDATAHAAVLLAIELEGLEEIIERHGYEAGRRVQSIVGRRLQECSDGEGLATRSSSGQYAVLLEHCQSPAEGLDLARRVVAAVALPVEVHSRSIAPRAVVGVAGAEDGTRTFEELWRRANVAKEWARGHHESAVLYTPHLEAEIAERIRWRAELEEALGAGQLVLHYQPIVEVATRRVMGVEALLRWRHPRLGMVPPDRFVPDLERTGLIVEAGAWVLSEAARTVQRWRAAFGEPVFVTVNVSNVQVEAPGFAQTVRTALQSSGLPASALVVELTETGLIHGTPDTLAQLREVRALGVRLALDDFGTGYSSLTYLERIRVDMLKIDKSFLDRAALDGQAPRLLRALLHLGAALGVQMLVEGVETQAQHRLLRRLGCPLAQGYLYARPLPAADAQSLIEAAAMAKTPEQATTAPVAAPPAWSPAEQSA